MRTKNKITREQHRVKKAQKQESKVICGSNGKMGT